MPPSGEVYPPLQVQTDPLPKFAVTPLDATCGFAARCAEGLCPSESEPPSLTLLAGSAESLLLRLCGSFSGAQGD
jgi:hypothetical protein